MTVRRPKKVPKRVIPQSSTLCRYPMSSFTCSFSTTTRVLEDSEQPNRRPNDATTSTKPSMDHSLRPSNRTLDHGKGNNAHSGNNHQRKNPWNEVQQRIGSPYERRKANPLKLDPSNRDRIGGSNPPNNKMTGNFNQKRIIAAEDKVSPFPNLRMEKWTNTHSGTIITSQDKSQAQRASSVGDQDGIEKLREAFMQTLSVDRQRRQAQAEQKNSWLEGSASPRSPFSRALAENVNMSSNSNSGSGSQNSTESRLDQLLRMSKRKPPSQGIMQNPSQHPMQQRQQSQQQNNQNNVNKTFRQRGQIQNWDEKERQRTRLPSEAQILQKELMKQNELVQNESGKDSDNLEDVGKEIMLPNRDVSLSQLSSIFRVQKDKLIQILRDLGESPPRGVELDTFKIDVDMAELVALELGLDPKREKRDKCSMEAAELRMKRQAQEEGTIALDEELYEKFPPRPPVVTIMGHVDHGKTTLMDRLRQKAAEALGITSKDKKKKGKKSKKSANNAGNQSLVGNIAGTEAGGITQVISAFQVGLPNVGDNDIDTVTFLDTPGHAAFKAMRQSGSNGADVIVLVVAADDGVSPQTIEIIDMYKSIARAQPGSISMVVAMTKIDKPGIDVEESLTRIENQLMEHEIFSERLATSSCEFDAVPIFPLSGMTGEGVDNLIEGLILQSEVMDLRACTESRAEGIIIDAKMEKGLGVVANCIIRWGKLEPGDYVVSGVHGGRVRILNDVNNKSISKAGPSQPVKIVGLKTLPRAGDAIICVKSEEIAKELISRREGRLASSNEDNSYRANGSKTNLDVVVSGGASKKGFMAKNVLKKYGLDEQPDDEETEKEIRIPVVLKADADGTLAALRDTLLAIQDESKLNLCIDPIEMSIGHVTPNDVNLAAESGAAIFCFNLKGSKDKTAMSLASANKVEIRSHNVIYHLLDEAKDVFSSYCPPLPVETIHGKAMVQAVFNINNNRNAEKVAGLMVKDGKLYLDKAKAESGTLNCEYRIKRGEQIVADGLKAKSLRRVKEDVEDVRRGEECGLNLGHPDIEEGDVI